jgi:hypothetical protein
MTPTLSLRLVPSPTQRNQTELLKLADHAFHALRVYCDMPTDFNYAVMSTALRNLDVAYVKLEPVGSQDLEVVTTHRKP